MRIDTITAETAARWHAARNAATADASRLAALLETGPLTPHLRLVASGPDGAFAAFAAEHRENFIRFWAPSFRTGLAADARAEAMRLFLENLVARRDSAGFAELPLETEPGDDQPDNALWLQALRATGFAETCVYRLHVLPRARFAAPRHAIPGLAVHSIEPPDLLNVTALFRDAYADTRERRDRGFAEPGAYIESLREIGEGYEPGLWLMAEFAGKPAALAIANRSREPDFPGVSAWLLEIGCLPAFRGRGIARALLAEILQRLATGDCERLMSTIDEINTPSIRLHDVFGFETPPERFYRYRRA